MKIEHLHLLCQKQNIYMMRLCESISSGAQSSCDTLQTCLSHPSLVTTIFWNPATDNWKLDKQIGENYLLIANQLDQSFMMMDESETLSNNSQIQFITLFFSESSAHLCNNSQIQFITLFSLKVQHMFVRRLFNQPPRTVQVLWAKTSFLS
jgi:hypothetical protein